MWEQAEDLSLVSRGRYRAHLAGRRGAGALHHGHVRHLHGQVAVVDERPRTLHLAGLELVAEGAQVRVAEQAAVGVLLVLPAGCASGLGRRAALVVAELRGGGARGAERLDGRRGPVTRAVVLREELADAQQRRVVGEVAVAAPRRPPRAEGVGSQRRAVVHGVGRRAGLIGQATRGRRGSHILRVAALDPTLLATC